MPENAAPPPGRTEQCVPGATRLPDRIAPDGKTIRGVEVDASGTRVSQSPGMHGRGASTVRDRVLRALLAGDKTSADVARWVHENESVDLTTAGARRLLVAMWKEETVRVAHFEARRRTWTLEAAGDLLAQNASH